MAVLIARPRLALKTIVVATDFSPASESALRYAAALAGYYGARIHLVHGAGPASRFKSGGQKETQEGNLRWAQARAKLHEQAGKCGGIECSSWLFTGSELDVVERLLSFDQTDLVVIGTQAARGLRRLSLGAAAEHFFRHVHCPVLAIGPRVDDASIAWQPRRILLATDLQSDETTAAKCAALLAREHEAELDLLHVAAPPAAPFPGNQEAIARSYFELRLRELLSYKPELDYPAECWVEFAPDPVVEILRVAEERDIDLIVMSVHREEPWGFHFVHEAYRIVAEAPCPVLITQRGL